MASEKSIKSFWNRAAAENPYWFVSSYGSYNADRDLDEFWASGSKIWEEIKRITGYVPSRVHKVIEIGCGVGRLSRAISPEVGHVTALDISENMLAIAKQSNLENVEFRIAQGFSLPGIENESVDLSLGYCVFQHLPSHSALESYLKEMCRVARRGGLVVFTLCPRDWKTLFLPALRARAYLRERLLRTKGPKGVYQREWVGIRPSDSTVFRLSPIHLDRHNMGAGRILYFGSPSRL